jgi:hypothetical protein
MGAAAVWGELESSAVTGAGRLRRRVEADSPQDLHLELAMPDRRRVLSLGLPVHSTLDGTRLPETRGLEHRLVDGSTFKTLSLELIDPAAADLFAILADDLIEVTSCSTDPASAGGAWTGRVARWQRLFRNGNQGLSAEFQRGLFAELWVMRELLKPAVGIAAAIGAWFGPDGSRHDYQLSSTSLEVKSCAANQPQIVSINGERQLDDTGTPSLHLIHISLDVHHNGPESLPGMIAAVRQLAAGSGAEAKLEDLLVEYGFLDLHTSRYANTGYTVRDHRAFNVREGFPRIIESELADGVGRVRYRLAIAACADFEVAESSVLALIKGGHES